MIQWYLGKALLRFVLRYCDEDKGGGVEKAVIGAPLFASSYANRGAPIRSLLIRRRELGTPVHSSIC